MCDTLRNCPDMASAVKDIYYSIKLWSLKSDTFETSICMYYCFATDVTWLSNYSMLYYYGFEAIVIMHIGRSPNRAYSIFLRYILKNSVACFIV